MRPPQGGARNTGQLVGRDMSASGRYGLYAEDMMPLRYSSRCMHALDASVRGRRAYGNGKCAAVRHAPASPPLGSNASSR